MTHADSTIRKALARALAGQATDLAVFKPAEVVATARRHGVELLLYWRLRDGTAAGLADAAVEELRSQTHAAVASDLLLNEATQAILDLLARHGRPALLLKGTALAHLHYSHSHLRRRCDTDILIRQEQVEAVARVLAEGGCRLSGLGQRMQSSRQFLAAFPMGGGHRVHFDIHWKLSNRVLFRDSLRFDACLAEAQAVPPLGTSAYALSDTDLLLHACIHRVAHGRNTERDRLLWLYDIHLLIEAMGGHDRKAFRTRALERKLGALCAEALGAARDLFGGSTPQGDLDELESRREEEPTAKLLHASKLGWAWGDMAALGSLREKAAFVRELLFG